MSLIKTGAREATILRDARCLPAALTAAADAGIIATAVAAVVVQDVPAAGAVAVAAVIK